MKSWGSQFFTNGSYYTVEICETLRKTEVLATVGEWDPVILCVMKPQADVYDRVDRSFLPGQDSEFLIDYWEALLHSDGLLSVSSQLISFNYIQCQICNYPQESY